MVAVQAGHRTGDDALVGVCLLSLLLFGFAHSHRTLAGDMLYDTNPPSYLGCCEMGFR